MAGKYELYSYPTFADSGAIRMTAKAPLGTCLIIRIFFVQNLLNKKTIICIAIHSIVFTS
jgi:hypothetical protein